MAVVAAGSADRLRRRGTPDCGSAPHPVASRWSHRRPGYADHRLLPHPGDHRTSSHVPTDERPLRHCPPTAADHDAGSLARQPGSGVHRAAATVPDLHPGADRRCALQQAGKLDRASAERRRQTVSLAQARARTLAQRRSNSFIHDHILSVFVSLTAGLGGSAQLRRAARHALQSLDSHALDQQAELSSPVLFDGLTQRIQAMSHETHEVEVSVSTPVSRTVPGSVAQALTDAVTEALRNSLKHAGDKNHPHVSRHITMRSDSSGLAITVTDNGRGFDPATPTPGRHGLTGSIQRRLTDVGARASIDSAPGRGTTVAMTWEPSADDQQSSPPSGIAAWPQPLASSIESPWARSVGTYTIAVDTLVVILESRSGAYTNALPAAFSLGAQALAAFLLLRSWPEVSIPRWAITIILLVITTTHLAVFLPIRTHDWPGFASWATGTGNMLCCGLLMRQRPKAAWTGELLLVTTAAIWVGTTQRPPIMVITYMLSHVITILLWTIIVRRFSAANVALTLTQAHTADILAARQATRNTDQVMAQAMASVRHRASPLLIHIATGQPLTMELRTQARLLEAELRDEIRAPFFTGTPVVQAARQARTRGTEVILLDDRGDQALPQDVRQQMITQVSEILTRPQQRVVARILPAGRHHLASILTDSGHTALGTDGRAVE